MLIMLMKKPFILTIILISCTILVGIAIAVAVFPSEKSPAGKPEAIPPQILPSPPLTTSSPRPITTPYIKQSLDEINSSNTDVKYYFNKYGPPEGIFYSTFINSTVTYFAYPSIGFALILKDATEQQAITVWTFNPTSLEVFEKKYSGTLQKTPSATAIPSYGTPTMYTGNQTGRY